MPRGWVYTISRPTIITKKSYETQSYTYVFFWLFSATYPVSYMPCKLYYPELKVLLTDEWFKTRFWSYYVLKDYESSKRPRYNGRYRW